MGRWVFGSPAPAGYGERARAAAGSLTPPFCKRDEDEVPLFAYTNLNIYSLF